jgi:hypothetical protein
VLSARSLRPLRQPATRIAHRVGHLPDCDTPISRSGEKLDIWALLVYPCCLLAPWWMMGSVGLVVDEKQRLALPQHTSFDVARLQAECCLPLGFRHGCSGLPSSIQDCQGCECMRVLDAPHRPRARGSPWRTVASAPRTGSSLSGADLGCNSGRAHRQRCTG